jgi:putative transposase
VQVNSTEGGAGRLRFFPDLVAHGLCRVALVTSDTQPGLGRDWRHSLPERLGGAEPATRSTDFDHPEILLAMGAKPTALHLRPVRR